MTCFHETINFQSSLLNKISILSNENYESYQTLLPFYLLIYLKDTSFAQKFIECFKIYLGRCCMKRIFTIIMIGILLVGCAKTDSLTEHDWVHYDTTCIETIYFGKDGHFAYYSDEGNPVNDSDLYDQYSYDSKSKKIHLKPTGDMSIQVLRYEKSRLLLNIDGDIKEFFDSKDKIIDGANPSDLAYQVILRMIKKI